MIKIIFSVACIINSCAFVFGADITAFCQMDRHPDILVQPIQGTVTFTQPATGGEVKVSISFSGFNASDSVTEHGFHVHTYGNLTNKCSDAGSHYNPLGNTHGGPEDENRHVGDLGNVKEDSNGRVETTITDSVIQLQGTYSIIGRAVVIHELPDDLGRGGHSDSNTTGHAGSRLGCCVIKDTTTTGGSSTLIISFPAIILLELLLLCLQW